MHRKNGLFLHVSLHVSSAVLLPALCFIWMALLAPIQAAAQQAPLDVPCSVPSATAPVGATSQQAPLNPLSGAKADAADSNLIATPTLNTSPLNPGTTLLFGLEKTFAAAVAKGGGPAFASFFDKDGVTIGNHTAAAIGQVAVAAQAKWSPADYQLTWTPEGGGMAPSGDMGFTWGHYEGRAKNSAATHGRYMTIWKKEQDGSWKVVLDSSNDDSPGAAH